MKTDEATVEFKPLEKVVVKKTDGIISEFKPLRRVFVFSISVRIFHWLNALCIMVLIATGLIMANPPAIQQGHEASFGYWFGTVRFIHFATAYIFTAALAFRIYFLFFGNRWERWNNFVPSNRAFFEDFMEVLKIDILLKKDKRHFAIGHNALAGMSYLALFIVMFLMIVTGFALYSDMSASIFPKMFNWITPLLGGDIMVRTVHHVAMWAFVIFILIHVYLVLFHDQVDARGEMSSMGGGYKFIDEEEFEKHKSEGTL